MSNNIVEKNYYFVTLLIRAHFLELNRINNQNNNQINFNRIIIH